MKHKKTVFIMIAVVLLIAAAAAILYRKYRPDNEGRVVQPQAAFSCASISFYRQRDAAWADDHLGESRFTMASSGCLTTALAAGLEMEKQKEDPAYELTPGELNRLFSDKGVYNSSGDIVWGTISNALDGVQVYVGKGVDSTIIDEFLREGNYPAVRVRVGGNGAMHWVLIVSSDETMYYCMDPLSQQTTAVPLSSFDSKIYSIRCVYWKAPSY